MTLFLIRFANTCLLVICLFCALPVAAQQSTSAQSFPGAHKFGSAQKSTSVFKVDYQKFMLKNGLEVIFHVDRSDPVVAVALTAHVGSAREKEGRTGFAHLFEHLLFLESENLGKGGL